MGCQRNSGLNVDESVQLYSRRIETVPAFEKLTDVEIAAESENVEDPFEDLDRRSAQEILTAEAGITWPEGASLVRSNNVVIFTNTKSNHDRLVIYLNETLPGKWKK